MDSSLVINPSPSEAHPETMDFLSHAWCNFAVQALQPDNLHQQQLPLDHQSMALIDPNIMMIKKIENDTKSTTSPYMVRILVYFTRLLINSLNLVHDFAHDFFII